MILQPMTGQGCQTFRVKEEQGPIGFGVDGDCYVGMGGVNDFYKYNVKGKVWESPELFTGRS